MRGAVIAVPKDGPAISAESEPSESDVMGLPDGIEGGGMVPWWWSAGIEAHALQQAEPKKILLGRPAVNW